MDDTAVKVLMIIWLSKTFSKYEYATKILDYMYKYTIDCDIWELIKDLCMRLFPDSSTV